MKTLEEVINWLAIHEGTVRFNRYDSATTITISARDHNIRYTLSDLEANQSVDPSRLSWEFLRALNKLDQQTGS